MKNKKSIYVHVEKRTKRKLMPSATTEEKQKAKNEVNIYKLGKTGYPSDHPFNKEGYRYILAEPDPFAPHRKEFDECEDWAGKPIPGWLYRQFSPLCVLAAMHDRAPQLKVAEDRLTVTGEKGYCMIRATHGVHFGNWYYEVDLLNVPDGGATRLGRFFLILFRFILEKNIEIHFRWVFVKVGVKNWLICMDLAVTIDSDIRGDLVKEQFSTIPKANITRNKVMVKVTLLDV